MKKLAILLLTTLLFINVGCSCDKKKKVEDDEQLDEITEVDKDTITAEQIVNGIRFKNVSMVVKNGKTEYRVTLENTLTTVKKISHLSIKFIGANDIVLQEVNRYDFDNLKKGDTQNLSYTFGKDLSSVVKIEYEFEE